MPDDINTDVQNAEAEAPEVAPEVADEAPKSEAAESTVTSEASNAPSDAETAAPAIIKPSTDSQIETESPVAPESVDPAPIAEPTPTPIASSDGLFPVDAAMSVEDQIEAWRDQANNVCLEINTTEGRDQAKEKLLNLIVKKINALNDQYGKENATESYQILIERRNMGNTNVLIVPVSKQESFAFRDDIEKALNELFNDDQDSLIEVCGNNSLYTESARIAVSTIAGYAIQHYPNYPDYVSPRKLLPLDELVLRGPVGANHSNNNYSLVR